MTAAFLHFFFLSSFCWVLTEAWQSYLAVIGRIRTRLVRKRFLCLGWGKGLGGQGGAGGRHRAPFPVPAGVVESLRGKLRHRGEQPLCVAPVTGQAVGSCQKGPDSVSPSVGAVPGGHSTAAPLQLGPVSLPSSRFASPRGRRLRRLHADQRLRDGELVRGAGGCRSVAAMWGQGTGMEQGAPPLRPLTPPVPAAAGSRWRAVCSTPSWDPLPSLCW